MAEAGRGGREGGQEASRLEGKEERAAQRHGGGVRHGDATVTGFSSGAGAVVLHPTYVEALLVGLAQLLAVAAPAGLEGGRRRWPGKQQPRGL